MGIIPLMTSKSSFLKTTFFFTFLLFFCGTFIPAFVPKVHALYFEDDSDENNDPHDTKSRPNHFDLFDWVGDAQNDSKKQHYRDLDNHDNGPGVNGGKRAGVIILSGLVGLGVGTFLGYEFTSGNGDTTSNMFIGGALGLGAGVLVGALIMPGDYNVEQHAQSDFLKQREAWLQDPIRMDVQKAFHPSQVAFRLQF